MPMRVARSVVAAGGGGGGTGAGAHMAVTGHGWAMDGH